MTLCDVYLKCKGFATAVMYNIWNDRKWRYINKSHPKGCVICPPHWTHPLREWVISKKKKSSVFFIGLINRTTQKHEQSPHPHCYSVWPVCRDQLYTVQHGHGTAKKHPSSFPYNIGLFTASSAVQLCVGLYNAALRHLFTYPLKEPSQFY